MKKLINYFFKSPVELFFPALCLHCETNLEEYEGLFCTGCGQLFSFLNEKEKSHPFLQDSAAAFEYQGPPATLIKKLKQGAQPYLAKGGGAYLFVKWTELNWPMPDMIVPVPQKFTHWIDRGYNQSYLLAKSMSHYLSKPVINALHCSEQNFSQRGKNQEQRKQLIPQFFCYQKAVSCLEDKIILLIDDVMTTGTTINSCAEALMQACPSQIYALTFCKTLVSNCR